MATLKYSTNLGKLENVQNSPPLQQHFCSNLVVNFLKKNCWYGCLNRSPPGQLSVAVIVSRYDRALAVITPIPTFVVLSTLIRDPFSTRGHND